MSGATPPVGPVAGAVADAAADAAARAVVERMMRSDAFSRWLGIELVDAGVRRATARMTVRAEMVNGFGIGHGGIVYSLADSVFAFATNSNGEISVAVDCTMSYPAAVRPGDVLTATGVERSGTRRLGFCDVTITNQQDVIVGLFRGTIYRTLKPLFPEDADAGGMRGPSTRGPATRDSGNSA